MNPRIRTSIDHPADEKEHALEKVTGINLDINQVVVVVTVDTNEVVLENGRDMNQVTNAVIRMMFIVRQIEVVEEIIVIQEVDIMILPLVDVKKET